MATQEFQEHGKAILCKSSGLMHVGTQSVLLR